MEKVTKLALIQDPALDKKGKQLVVNGEKQYKRDDFVGLINLLNRFDSKKHAMPDYKMLVKVKDRIFANWEKEDKCLELSVNEANFLKDYLVNLNTRDAVNDSLREFEIRTLVGITEQFEGGGGA